MKTLLIEDDEWIRGSLSLLFESERCFLRAFETAEEGTKAIKKQDYDIIIADYRLPGMDGLEFLKWTQESHPAAMKILITAYGNEGVVYRAMLIGIQDIIKKPFTYETIKESLAKVIEDSKGK